MEPTPQPVAPPADIPDSFSAIVNLWPSAEALAADIGEKGVTVRQMRNRDSIDAGYWERILAAAAVRGFHAVTSELLIKLAARKKEKSGDAVGAGAAA